MQRRRHHVCVLGSWSRRPRTTMSFVPETESKSGNGNGVWKVRTVKAQGRHGMEKGRGGGSRQQSRETDGRRKLEEEKKWQPAYGVGEGKWQRSRMQNGGGGNAKSLGRQ